MHQILKILLPLVAFLAVASLPPAAAATPEKRLALVIGNSSYQIKNLATPVNDAALIAQTLQAAGFDVMGARDLDRTSLSDAFRDFVDRVTKAGPGAVAAVYFAGYGLQLEGENYLVPIDADITRDSDVPLRALRLSDYTLALAAIHLKATFVILDAARASPFALSGQPLAGGLAWVEPEPNVLIALNAAPGTVAPDGPGGYGSYAKALAEMIREGGLPPANLFDRVRLRVNELTEGAQVPWDASKIETQFIFFERGLGAPLRADLPEQTAWMRSQPMRKLGAQNAYMVALLRDTFDGYGDFLADYGHDPMARRVHAILAARREAITWRRTYQVDTPEAYWSYLKRYPRGPHTADARRLLERLAAALEPPSKFTMTEYDVPSPLPFEREYVERSVLVFDDPEFAFAPPPPSPGRFLEPPPAEFLVLEPPPASNEVYILPVPAFVRLPPYVVVPANVVAPPNQFTFNKIDSRAAIDNTSRTTTIIKPDGQVEPTLPISPARAAGGASYLAVGPVLPPSIALRAALINSQRPPTPAVNPVTREEIKVPLGRPLPTTSSALPPPTDYEPMASRPVATPAPPPTDNQPPAIPIPGTVALPATGNVRLQAPHAAILSPQATGAIPLPIPRQLTLMQPATGNIPLPIPRAATLSLQTTGDIPLPVPRAATLPPPVIGNRLRSGSPATVISQPTVVDLAEPPTPPANHRAALPPPAVAGAAKSIAQARPQLKPPEQTCQIVNGRRACR